MCPVLMIKDIHKTFESGTINENHVLKGICLTVNAGDFITIIGGNGSGKSTLMNILSGSLTIDEGEIDLDGKSIVSLSVEQRAKWISRVFQDPKMGTASRLTIEENLALASKKGQKRGMRRGISVSEKQWFSEQLKLLNLGLEHRMKVDTQFLSGGQRQALTLLMATLVKPKLLLLDEHTAALDPKTSEQIMHLTQHIVEQNQLTALMITHNLEHAIRYGNRLVMLHHGKIIFDISGEDKQNLTVSQIMDLFQSQHSGEWAL